MKFSAAVFTIFMELTAAAPQAAVYETPADIYDSATYDHTFSPSDLVNRTAFFEAKRIIEDAALEAARGKAIWQLYESITLENLEHPMSEEADRLIRDLFNVTRELESTARRKIADATEIFKVALTEVAKNHIWLDLQDAEEEFEYMYLEFNPLAEAVFVPEFHPKEWKDGQ